MYNLIKVLLILFIMEINKEHIILLGDGFFARGFLHNINYKKFNVTQIYKDEFINPQDIMYALERDQKYEKSFHFRDLFYKKPIKIKQEIVSMKINNNNININDNFQEILSLEGFNVKEVIDISDASDNFDTFITKESTLDDLSVSKLNKMKKNELADLCTKMNKKITKKSFTKKDLIDLIIS